MRHWHRALAPWLALLLALISLTGLATQATDLLDSPARPAAVAMIRPAPGRKPPSAKRSAMGEWNHWLKKLHSGEALGPAGIALNLAGGFALVFFAVSGAWMYLSMWLKRRRGRRTRRNRSRGTTH